jgi:Fe-S oxidoreductase
MGRHFSEFLANAFKEGQLKVKGELRVKVSYHDPCHLSRGLGVHKATREVLSFLGVELLEMERHGENTYCCGGGGRNGALSEFSNWVAGERFSEFRKTGADLLLTACPWCKEAFRGVLPAKERERVKDLIEFVDEVTK